MTEFSYYDEIDSQVLRQQLRASSSFPIVATEQDAPEADKLWVDPSSTAFIDGSMVEALLRRSR